MSVSLVCEINRSMFRIVISESFADYDLGVSEKGKDFYLDFLKKTVELEEKITGLLCDELQIILYNSGDGCIKTLLETVSNILYEKYEKNFESLERTIEKEIIKRPKRLLIPLLKIGFKNAWKIPFIPLIYKMSKKLQEYSVNHILGGYDLIELGIGNYGVLRLVPANIERVANKNGIDVNSLKKMVIIHERIHHRQAQNFPELYNKRLELAKNIMYSFIAKIFGLEEAVGINVTKMNKEKIEETKALMSLLEGHASYFTNKVM